MNKFKMGDIIKYTASGEYLLPCRRNGACTFGENVWIDDETALFIYDCDDDVYYAWGFGDEEFMIREPEKFTKCYLVEEPVSGFKLNTYYRVKTPVTVIKIDDNYTRIGESRLMEDDLILVADEFEDDDSIVAQVMGGSNVEIRGLWRDNFEEVEVKSKR